MTNSKWVKLVPKENILSLKEDGNFKFCSTNLAKYFNIPDKRMGELLKFYEIEIQKLTKNVKLTTEEWISDNLEYYKIGISTNFKKRLIKLKGSHRATVEVIHKTESNLFDCAKKEGELLSKYKRYNKKGEVPFGIDGSTECLSVDTPISEIINNLK